MIVPEKCLWSVGTLKEAAMPKRPLSSEPESFTSEKERHYWQMAQDIAFRAGFLLLLRDGSTWSLSDAGEQLICTPSNPEHIWFETWAALKEAYPRLSRLWGIWGPLNERRPSK